MRARLRTLVKRLLQKYGYLPDKQKKAAETSLEQAELSLRTGLRDDLVNYFCATVRLFPRPPRRNDTPSNAGHVAKEGYGTA